MYKYFIPIFLCAVIFSCKKPAADANYTITSSSDTLLLYGDAPVFSTLNIKTITAAKDSLQLKETSLPSFIQTSFSAGSNTLSFYAAGNAGINDWGVYKATIVATNAAINPLNIWIKYTAASPGNALAGEYTGIILHHRNPNERPYDTITTVIDNNIMASAIPNTIYISLLHNSTDTTGAGAFKAVIDPYSKTFIVTGSPDGLYTGCGHFSGSNGNNKDSVIFNFIYAPAGAGVPAEIDTAYLYRK